VTLTPADIEAHVFREKFKGYDQDEVDEFLDRVSDQISQLIADRDRLEERVRRMEEEALESADAERLLKRTLIMAQRTADETVAEAREEAERMRADAERHALDVREDAEHRAAAALEDAARRAAAAIEEADRRAAATLADAEQRAAAIVAEANRHAEHDRRTAREELDRIRDAVAELQRLRTDYRDRVRGVIAEQLAALDRIGDMPDLPPQLASLPARGAALLDPDTAVAVEGPRGRGGVGGPADRLDSMPTPETPEDLGPVGTTTAAGRRDEERA
jgi:DivIVA domain-containing protein